MRLSVWACAVPLEEQKGKWISGKCSFVWCIIFIFWGILKVSSEAMKSGEFSDIFLSWIVSNISFRVLDPCKKRILVSFVFIARSQIKKLENAKKNQSRKLLKGFSWAQSTTKIMKFTGSCCRVMHIWREIVVLFMCWEDCDVNSLAPQTLGVSPMCSFLCKLELEDSLHMHLLFEFEVRHFFLMNRTFHLLHLLIFDAYCIVYFIFINYVHAHHWWVGSAQTRFKLVDWDWE